MKAINTAYKGYLFRSRLEARWAVYFDALGLKWQYESEGYDVDGIWYLPDFYLPEMDIFIEVKSEDCEHNHSLYLLEDDFEKVTAFSKHKKIAVVCGNPHARHYYYFGPDGENTITFWLEEKGKNNIPGKTVPYWRVWWAAEYGDFSTMEPFVSAIQKANYMRFEHGTFNIVT